MKKKKSIRRVMAMVLSVLLMMSCLVPCQTVFAADQESNDASKQLATAAATAISKTYDRVMSRPYTPGADDIFMSAMTAYLRKKDDPNPVKPGPYTNDIEKAEAGCRLTLPVEGYPDVTVQLYVPKTKKGSLPLIVYFHGGGYFCGDEKSVGPYAKLLASNGYVVANVEYALSPENTYPAALMQSITAADYLYQNAAKYRIDSTKIFFGGNSAGAHLASQVALCYTNPTYATMVAAKTNIPAKNIRGLLLYNGVYNFETFYQDDFGFPGFDKYLGWAWTGRKDYRNDPRLHETSTVYFVNKDFPSCFITVGDADKVKIQTDEFIGQLKKNNIDYTSLLWDGSNAGLGHDYIYNLERKEAQKAYQMSVEYLNAHSK